MNVPYYKVGQNPCQGDMNFDRQKPFSDGTGVQPDPSLSLIED